MTFVASCSNLKRRKKYFPLLFKSCSQQYALKKEEEEEEANHSSRIGRRNFLLLQLLYLPAVWWLGVPISTITDKETSPERLKYLSRTHEKHKTKACFHSPFLKLYLIILLYHFFQKNGTIQIRIVYVVFVVTKISKETRISKATHDYFIQNISLLSPLFCLKALLFSCPLSHCMVILLVICLSILYTRS